MVGIGSFYFTNVHTINMQAKEDNSAIERFFSNDCDYAEAERIAFYLKNNQGLLDAIDLFPSETNDQKVSYAEKERIVQGILNRENENKIFHINRKLIAAACFIGVLLLGVYFIKQKEITPPVAVVTDVYFKNITSELITYTLPDSTKLSIVPGAEIFYKSDFVKKRELLLLNGDVFFKVHSDLRHPFSVTSYGIKTTALGTQFWVRTFKESETLVVSLNEGKVVIHSVDSNFPMDAVYLKPEQICTIDKQKGRVDVSGFYDAKKLRQKTILLQKTVAPPDNIQKNEVVWSNNAIQFSNTTLQNVFSKLEQRYDITIIPKGQNLPNSFLTGKVMHNDSLETIIKALCEINKLSYEISSNKDTIYITKP